MGVAVAPRYVSSLSRGFFTGRREWRAPFSDIFDWRARGKRKKKALSFVHGNKRKAALHNTNNNTSHLMVVAVFFLLLSRSQFSSPLSFSGANFFLLFFSFSLSLSGVATSRSKTTPVPRPPPLSLSPFLSAIAPTLNCRAANELGKKEEEEKKKKSGRSERGVAAAATLFLLLLLPLYFFSPFLWKWPRGYFTPLYNWRTEVSSGE